MNDTLFCLSSAMSNEHERIQDIIYHINQLLSELRVIEPNNSYLEKFPTFNMTINSSSTIINNEKCLLDNQCPYLSHKQAILHSTTYHDYRKNHKRKKFLLLSSPPKKHIFTNSACMTSTPKTSPNQNILIKPHLTSTPRRNKRQSSNIIPLKRLLYNNNNSNKLSHRQRYSTKRSIITRYCTLNAIDENPQWI